MFIEYTVETRPVIQTAVRVSPKAPNNKAVCLCKLFDLIHTAQGKFYLTIISCSWEEAETGASQQFWTNII